MALGEGYFLVETPQGGLASKPATPFRLFLPKLVLSRRGDRWGILRLLIDKAPLPFVPGDTF